MRIAGLCAGVALAALALQSQPDPGRVTVPFSDASRPRMLTVSLLNGSISVTGYSGKDAVIETATRQRQRPDPRAEGLRRIDSGSRLKVEERDNTITVSAGDSVDLTVQVPFDTALRLKTVNGNTTVQGIAGEIDANNVNGAVTLRNVSGAVVAHSLNRDLTVVFDRVAPDKAMSFSTMNGNVDVTMPADVKARVKMKTDNGEIYSDFEIQTEPGPAAAGTARIRFDKAIHGTINGGGPEMQFTTFNGRIYLRKK